MLMDIRLRNERDGIWAAQAVFEMFGIPSVFVTGEQAMFEGARESLLKTFGYEPIVVTKPVVGVDSIMRGIEAVLQLTRNGIKKYNTRRGSLFVSYCQKDSRVIAGVFSVLREWAKERGVEVWIDRDVVEPGDRHVEVISTAINRARVAILFVSLEYSRSRFILENELPWLKRAEDDGAKLVPIVVDDCGYNSIPVVRDLLALNPRSVPLNAMPFTERLTRVVQLCEWLDSAFASAEKSHVSHVM
jgi:hypothetical protein